MRAEIHFFYCGNGDTILVRAGDEWGIVDCNLTKASGARERLLSVLDKNHVKKLRFVCITHYDSDHLRGVAKLLRERFCEEFGDGENRRRRWLVEQLIQPLQAKDIMRALALLESAIKCVDDHKIDLEFSKEALEFLRLTKEMLTDGFGLPNDEKVYLPSYSTPSLLAAPPFFPYERVVFGPFEVCFLSPEQDTADQFEADAFYPIYEKFLHNPDELRQKITANNVSRVVAFRHIDTDQAVLLGADAPDHCWPQIMKRWKEICSHGLRSCDQPRWNKFHLIKVSHHGAKDSHYPALFSDWATTEKTVALISSRSCDPKHPHPDVWSNLTARGVRLEVTGSVATATKQAAKGPLIGKRRTTFEEKANDVCIHFDKGGLRVERCQVDD